MHLCTRSAVLERGVYTGVSLVTAVGARELLGALGVNAWAVRVSGLPPLVVGLFAAVVAVVVSFLVWGVLFKLVHGTRHSEDWKPVVLLEIAIVLMTAAVAAGFLYDAVDLPRPLALLAGLCASVIVWVPWLRLRRDETFAGAR